MAGNLNNRLARSAYGSAAMKGLSALERIRYVTDFAYAAANEGDKNRLLQALMVLRAGLNFEEEPLIALEFLRLFQYCQRVVEEREDYPEAARILYELSRAWHMAEYEPGSHEAEELRARGE
jgi:hypothetical protein